MKKSLAGKPPRQTKRVRLQKRMDAALDQLAQGELVKPLPDAERAYSIKHALVQDTAQSTLLHGEYKRLNLLVADAYETVFATRCMDEFAGVLAQHYAAADDDAKTLSYAMHAGDLAASAYANAEAIALYSLALDAAKRSSATTAQFIHLYTKRGRVLEVMADPEALTTYQEMASFARARGDRALEMHALLLQGKLHAAPTHKFSRDMALALADAASQIADELGDRQAQARALWNQQLTYLYNSEISDAIRCGEKALALARELDARELLGFVLTDLARAYLQAGQMTKVPPLDAEAQRIWRELDNKPMLADNLMQTATQAMLHGDYDSCLALAEEGVEISRAIGSKVSLMANQGTQLVPCVERGEFERALQLVEDIVRESEEITGGFTLQLQSALGAWVNAIVGATGRAAELAQKAHSGLEQPTAEFFRSWAWVLLARYALATGDLAAAQSALASSQMENHLDRVDPAGLFGVLALAECLAAQGEFELAARQMADRVAVMRRMGLRQSLPEALLIQANAVRGLGDTAQAVELLHQARTTAEEMQARRLLWQIYAALSDIEIERGNKSQGEIYRMQARDVLAYIVAHIPEELRAGFLGLPAVREVMA